MQARIDAPIALACHGFLRRTTPLDGVPHKCNCPSSRPAGASNGRQQVVPAFANTCETRVVEGIPDHRDNYLTDEEKATNKVIMICCSRSKSPVLVLDL